MSECPLARSEGLVVEPLDDELLVFDSQVGRAHSLNASAAAVWRSCDGTRTREQLAAEAGLELAAVDLALESLAGCELLIDFTPSTQRVSRRTVLRQAAVAGAGVGMALPVIRSIAAPSAAMAASGANAKCGGCPSGSYCGSVYSGPGSNPPYECVKGTPPGSGAHCLYDGPPCASTSHCSWCSTCHPGYQSNARPGDHCTNNTSCSYNATCDTGTSKCVAGGEYADCPELVHKKG